MMSLLANAALLHPNPVWLGRGFLAIILLTLIALLGDLWSNRKR